MKELNIEIAVKIYDYEELDAADRELMDAAREATNRSYAPYSHFSVGAAARLANGIVVTGTNQTHRNRFCKHLFVRAQRVPGVSHSSLRCLPASDARNGKALQASHEGVAIWQKGNLRAEECGRITATLVRCFGHEVTVPIKY